MVSIQISRYDWLWLIIKGVLSNHVQRHVITIRLITTKPEVRQSCRSDRTNQTETTLIQPQNQEDPALSKMSFLLLFFPVFTYFRLVLPGINSDCSAYSAYKKGEEKENIANPAPKRIIATSNGNKSKKSGNHITHILWLIYMYAMTHLHTLWVIGYEQYSVNGNCFSCCSSVYVASFWSSTNRKFLAADRSRKCNWRRLYQRLSFFMSIRNQVIIQSS